MILGVVTDGYATVPVTFCLPNRPSLDIQFVIDTGFTDYLCLPSEAIAVLNLPFLYDLSANLANNNNVILPVHEATIMWHQSRIKVRVLATGRRPLLGKSLLDGCVLTVRFIEGGLVTIEQIKS